MTDNLDDLLRDLGLGKAGWYRAEGPRGSAIFPETAKDVDAWEARCLAMHDAQEPVTVEEKPITNHADYVRELRRGN